MKWIHVGNHIVCFLMMRLILAIRLGNILDPPCAIYFSKDTQCHIHLIIAGGDKLAFQNVYFFGVGEQFKMH